MREPIIYFDIAALLIAIFLLIGMFSKKLYRSSSSKAYIILIVILGITTIFDSLSCFNKYLSINALVVGTTFYHLFRNILLLYYLIYIISICNLESVIRRKKYLMIFIFLPITIILGLVISNPWTKWIFYYDYIDNENLVSEYPIYHRNSLMIFIYVNSIIYFTYILIILIKYRKLFTKRELASIAAIFPLTIISLLIQFFNSGYLVEMMFSSFAAILISISIERPEEFIDEKFYIGSSKYFIKNAKRLYLLKEESYIVILKIKNYFELYNQFNYDEAINYVRLMINELQKGYKALDKTFSPYYLNDGIFGVFLADENMANSIAEQVIVDMNRIKTKKTKYVPDSQIVIVNVLKDFKNYQELLFFINNYKNRLAFDNDIVKFKDIKNDELYKIMSNIDIIIDNGLKNNEFEVYYQPIYNVRSGKFHSAEALVRLFSKDYGFIPPSLFIPYAEKNGMVIDIDYFVFESVCKFISSDDYKNLGLDYIEVNFSTFDCINPNLYSNIIGLMEKYGVKPNQINIEITESFDSLNEKMATENINKLKEYGLTFSLDDYGTGYSNIERFSILPISLVKIDKSLVDSSDDQKMYTVLKNTFSLIKSLKRKTIIEGVETKAQADAFIGFDCDNIQGYYYSRPLPQDDFVKFIKEKNK